MKRTILLKLTFALLATCFGIISVNGQGEKGEDLPQYLFSSFSGSMIRKKDGKDLTLNLNYNMVSEKMVFEQKGQFYDLTKPGEVDTAYIEARKFIPHENEFVEVLEVGNVSLFIQHKADIQAPPKTGAYGTTSELSSTKNISGYQTDVGYFNLKLPEGITVRYNPFYWIRKGEEWFKVSSEKQVAKIFPGNEDQVKDYIKANKIKSDRLDDMKKLAVFCNSLSK